MLFLSQLNEQLFLLLDPLGNDFELLSHLLQILVESLLLLLLDALHHQVIRQLLGYLACGSYFDLSKVMDLIVAVVKVGHAGLHLLASSIG